MRCAGYDDDGKAFACPNKAGTRWTPVWCPECDTKRRARISASLQSMADDLARKAAARG